ncbi:MAG: hypothetical protein JO352_31855 [Chloroflexi bacterium]|nr:hypothetical protein [Chloroflexota bacterium]
MAYHIADALVTKYLPSPAVIASQFVMAFLRASGNENGTQHCPPTDTTISYGRLCRVETEYGGDDTMGLQGWTEYQDGVTLVGAVTGDNYSDHSGPDSTDDWDWSIFVQPATGYDYLATNNQGVRNDNGVIECEIQAPDGLQDWASTHRYIDPLIGRTITMAGTWVDDISHNRKTEIHPITLVIAEEWEGDLNVAKLVTFMAFCDTYDWQPFRPFAVPHSNELRTGTLRVAYPASPDPTSPPILSVLDEINRALPDKDIHISQEANQAFLLGTVQVDRGHPFYFGRFRLTYQAGPLYKWQWSPVGQPVGAVVASAPSVVGYRDGGVQQIKVFARGDKGNLTQAYWSDMDRAWTWHDHGQADGTAIASAPASFGWVQTDGTNRLNVFAMGGSGQLVEAYWDGSDWLWNNHGNPPGSALASGTAVVGWVQSDGKQRLNVFAMGANGQLIEAFYDGDNWHWNNHGTPPETAINSAPTAVSWVQSDGKQRLNVFAMGANGNLIEAFYDGDNWQWNDHGPPPGTAVASAPTIIGYVESSAQIFDLFVEAANGNLVQFHYDGDRWGWSDRGQPPGTMIASAPAIVRWVEGTSTQRLNVFARGSNGNLIELWMDGNGWHWSDHGQPGEAALASPPASVGWVQTDGVQRPNVFATQTNGRMGECWWS